MKRSPWLIEGANMQFHVQLRNYEIELKVGTRSGADGKIIDKPILWGYIYQGIIKKTTKALAEYDRSHKE